ncbi:MAG TPA: DUF6371 domain-containing protein [Bacteroidia bacterium]|jgi:hypothetical protein|nr:DUF6371 domain-containing protein [Bacteroidia bacterium]
MKTYPYILQPYKGMSTRFVCPACKKPTKTFTLYISTKTNEALHHTVGKCNRLSKCGYHYTPKQYFIDNNIAFTKPVFCKPPNLLTQQPVSYIPDVVFTASLKQYSNNHFVQFLSSLFSANVVTDLVNKYYIGTAKYWQGATVFWQVDALGKIHTGKLMLYNPTTGKRVKQPYNHIQWAHKTIGQAHFNLQQCFFGEHLLAHNNQQVALVESEKTALIASVYLPDFIWLAVGSLSNLSLKKCAILKGKTVTLYPDLNAFEKWNTKAKELSTFCEITVSDLLEHNATQTEKQQGLDLADYLVGFM